MLSLGLHHFLKEALKHDDISGKAWSAPSILNPSVIRPAPQTSSGGMGAPALAPDSFISAPNSQNFKPISPETIFISA